MNLSRTTRLALAFMLVAPALLAASSAPAAESQAMSGGPQNVCCLDNFNRADENPLSGGGNWAPLDTGVYHNDLQLSNSQVRAAFNDYSVGMRYWTPQTFGPDSEVYFQASGQGDINEGVRMVLRVRDPGGPNTWDGYMLISYEPAPANHTWYLRRYTNGSFAGGSLAQVEHPATTWMLFRAVGNQLEGWGSNDGVNWTLVISATDPTYSQAGYLGIGM